MTLGRENLRRLKHRKWGDTEEGLSAAFSDSIGHYTDLADRNCIKIMGLSFWPIDSNGHCLCVFIVTFECWELILTVLAHADLMTR
jgi:hypothetical protein